MPRAARVDSPGCVHHVMFRGIERGLVFRDDEDREGFLGRLDRLIPELGFCCFAWSLMPNHVHLALQTGPVPLPRLMARLGTSYAVYFNRRHGRVGHLLQNRYRSRLVGDETDLIALVLYIHRNPLRGGLVSRPEALGAHPWCGHGALTGERPPRPFEVPERTLGLLARDPVEARLRLDRWMQAPAREDEHRLGATANLPRGAGPARRARSPSGADASLDRLIQEVCATRGVTREALGPGLRTRVAVDARAELAHRATAELGLPSRRVARALGISEAAVSRALSRAARGGARVP